jgi:hypothetical protein
MERARLFTDDATRRPTVLSAHRWTKTQLAEPKKRGLSDALLIGTSESVIVETWPKPKAHRQRDTRVSF